MFKNYLKVAIRNLGKRKGFTFLNVFGLAIGVGCCLLIVLYVLNELSYDRFNQKADRIYRVTQTTITPAKEETETTTPFLVGPMMEGEYPNWIERSVRFYNRGDKKHSFLDVDAKDSFRTDGFFFTDSTFFEVFSGSLLRGNPDEALDEPLSLVISEELARRYYKDENPIGKTVRYQGIKSMTMTVTGVMRNWPEESHMNIQALASFSSLKVLFHRNPDYMDNWWINPVWTYVLLDQPASAGQVNNQLSSFVDKYYSGTERPEGEKVELGLQPLTDIHLHSNLGEEMNANGSITSVYLFSAVAVLILLIACVNFMNLATAQSVERGREVGMRKVLGADRRQLFKQFMGESLLISLLVVLSAMILVYLFMPIFNDITGKALGFSQLLQPGMLAFLLALVLVVGFVAGTYPAMYLSGYNPSAILRGEITRGKWSIHFRKGLVIFQFALSVMLIVGTIVVYLQLQHMQNKEMGFSEEQVIILPMNQNLIAWRYDRFREAALKESSIRSVTGISKILGSSKTDNWQIFPASTPQGEEKSTHTLHVNYDFLDTYGIELIAGRGFSEDYSTDKEQAILINREMVRELGYETPSQAIGEQFRYETSVDHAEDETYSVIGVVENFHYTSLKKEIQPVVIRLATGTRQVLTRLEHAAIKVSPGGIPSALEHLENIWNEINFVDPFEYSFQDQELEKIYAAEAKMSKVAGIFTVLCILVACLGLFGLASYTASKRTKEIGIRKALGASVSSIILLLSREYIKLVLLANLLAWPIIYYLTLLWLQDFPSRINLGWNIIGVFLITGLISIIICLLTVSYQSSRAALINPVDSIRQE